MTLTIMIELNLFFEKWQQCASVKFWLRSAPCQKEKLMERLWNQALINEVYKPFNKLQNANWTNAWLDWLVWLPKEAALEPRLALDAVSNFWDNASTRINQSDARIK